MRLFQTLPNAPHNDARVYCYTCNHIQPLNRVVCDLDGPAFRAYYCQSCAFSLILNYWDKERELENQQ